MAAEPRQGLAPAARSEPDSPRPGGKWPPVSTSLAAGGTPHRHCLAPVRLRVRPPSVPLEVRGVASLSPAENHGAWGLVDGTRRRRCWLTVHAKCICLSLHLLGEGGGRVMVSTSWRGPRGGGRKAEEDGSPAWPRCRPHCGGG